MADQGQGGQGGGWPRHEKDEKGQEKQEEKGQSLDEKYRRNPVGFVSFALLIIWLGIFLLLQNRGVFDRDHQGWAIFFWGWAGLSLAEALIRLATPRWRQPVVGNIVGAAVFAGIGIGLWSNDNWEIIGPIILIAVGVVLVLGRLRPRR